MYLFDGSASKMTIAGLCEAEHQMLELRWGSPEVLRCCSLVQITHARTRPRGRAEKGEERGDGTEGQEEGGGALKASILSFKCEAWRAGWGFRRGSVLLS